MVLQKQSCCFTLSTFFFGFVSILSFAMELMVHLGFDFLMPIPVFVNIAAAFLNFRSSTSVLSRVPSLSLHSLFLVKVYHLLTQFHLRLLYWNVRLLL